MNQSIEQKWNEYVKRKRVKFVFDYPKEVSDFLTESKFVGINKNRQDKDIECEVIVNQNQVCYKLVKRVFESGLHTPWRIIQDEKEKMSLTDFFALNEEQSRKLQTFLNEFPFEK